MAGTTGVRPFESFTLAEKFEGVTVNVNDVAYAAAGDPGEFKTAPYLLGGKILAVAAPYASMRKFLEEGTPNVRLR